MEACAARDHAAIEAQLSASTDVNARAKRDAAEGGGETALMIAAEKADLWAVKRLLRAGADVRILSERKYSAVYYAVVPRTSPERRKVVHELIKAGCPLLGEELHPPVWRRDVQTTRLLLAGNCPGNARLRYSELDGPDKGETPLTTAVSMSALDFMETLGFKEERTVERRRQIVRMLLAYGADVRLPNAKGRTPLMIVQREDDPTLVKVIEAAARSPLRRR
jgi:ankyrin repeat protein